MPRNLVFISSSTLPQSARYMLQGAKCMVCDSWRPTSRLARRDGWSSASAGEDEGACGLSWQSTVPGVERPIVEETLHVVAFHFLVQVNRLVHVRTEDGNDLVADLDLACPPRGASRVSS